MTSFIAAGGSGRSTSFIPAVPAAWSVTTIAFMGIVSSVISLFGENVAAIESCQGDRVCRIKPGKDGRVSPRHMRRYREPFSVLLRPAIGVSPVRMLPVWRGVAGCSVDDGEVAHDSDLHVMGLQVLDRDWFRGLLKEGGAIDQRFVGI